MRTICVLMFMLIGLNSSMIYGQSTDAFDPVSFQASPEYEYFLEFERRFMAPEEGAAPLTAAELEYLNFYRAIIPNHPELSQYHSDSTDMSTFFDSPEFYSPDEEDTEAFAPLAKVANASIEFFHENKISTFYETAKLSISYNGWSDALTSFIHYLDGKEVDKIYVYKGKYHIHINLPQSYLLARTWRWRLKYVKIKNASGSRVSLSKTSSSNYSLSSDLGYGVGEHNVTVYMKYAYEIRGITLNDYIYERNFKLVVLPTPDELLVASDGSQLALFKSGDLDNPVLVSEGFDPLNKTNGAAFYNVMKPVFDYIGNVGSPYDFFLINYKDGGAAIRSNADVYIAACDVIREKLDIVGLPDANIVAAGVSMGGVVGRYATAKYSDVVKSHRIKKFISVDSPQQGAWIPGEIQGLIHNFRSKAEPMWKALNSQAAKDMMYVFQDTGDPIAREHLEFMDELKLLNNGVGYPSVCKKYAYANGSLKTHDDKQTNVAKLYSDLGDWNIYKFKTKYLDKAPGSYLPSSMCKNFSLFQWRFHPTFIPTISALDLDIRLDYNNDGEIPAVWKIDTSYNNICLEAIKISKFDDVNFQIAGNKDHDYAGGNVGFFFLEWLNEKLPLGPPAENIQLTADVGSNILTWIKDPYQTKMELKEFRIYRQERVVGGSIVDSFNFSSPYAVVGPEALTFTDNALTAGHEYAYLITAVDYWNDESTIDLDNVIYEDSPFPAAPLNMAVRQEVSGLDVSNVVTWARNTANADIVSYELFKRLPDGSIVTIPGLSSATFSFKDSNIVKGNVYSYKVRAVNSVGRKGAFTRALHERTSPNGCSEIRVVGLGTFGGLDAVNGLLVNVSHNDAYGDAASFNVIRRFSIGYEGNYAPAEERRMYDYNPSGMLRFTHTHKVLPPAYNVVITVIDKAGNESEPAEVNFIIPQAPKNFSVTPTMGAASEQLNRLSWEYNTANDSMYTVYGSGTRNSVPTGYYIYRKRDDETSFYIIGSTSNTSFVDSLSIQNHSYEYKVAATAFGTVEGQKTGVLTAQPLHFARITSHERGAYVWDDVVIKGDLLGDIASYRLEYAAGNGAASVWYSVNASTSVSSDTNRTLGVWSVGQLPDGEYTIRMVTKDSNGQEHAFSVMCNVIDAGKITVNGTGAYPKLSIALATAPENAVIRVPEGEYGRDIVMINKPIRIVGDGAGLTVLNDHKITSVNDTVRGLISISGCTFNGTLTELEFGPAEVDVHHNRFMGPNGYSGTMVTLNGNSGLPYARHRVFKNLFKGYSPAKAVKCNEAMNALIFNNTFSGFRYGVQMTAQIPSGVKIEDNVFMNHSGAAVYNPGGNLSDAEHLVLAAAISNNCFWSNSMAWKLSEASRNAAPPAGFTSDNLFEDPGLDDDEFVPFESSPCVDAAHTAFSTNEWPAQVVLVDNPLYFRPGDRIGVGVTQMQMIDTMNYVSGEILTRESDYLINKWNIGAEVGISFYGTSPDIGYADYYSDVYVVDRDVTWAGEVVLTSDVYIKGTLRIKPGTVVRFAAFRDDAAGGLDPLRSELIVEGYIDAENCLFTSDVAGGWYGIRCSGDWGASGCRIDSVVIENAIVGIAANTAANGIHHSIFRNNGKHDIVAGGVATIANNSFQSGYGFGFRSNVTASSGPNAEFMHPVTIRNNEFINNYSPLGLRIFDTKANDIAVYDNVIRTQNGIYDSCAHTRIYRNLLEFKDAYGIMVEDEPVELASMIPDKSVCMIYNNNIIGDVSTRGALHGTGILLNGAWPHIVNNVFQGLTYGIETHAAAADTPVISNNAFYRIGSGGFDHRHEIGGVVTNLDTVSGNIGWSQAEYDALDPRVKSLYITPLYFDYAGDWAYVPVRTMQVSDSLVLESPCIDNGIADIDGRWPADDVKEWEFTGVSPDIGMKEYGLVQTTGSLTEITLIDPDGNTVTSSSSDITNSNYIEYDIDGNGQVNDIITVPDVKLGTYTLIVEPAPSIPDSEVYMLSLNVAGRLLLLADSAVVHVDNADTYYVDIDPERPDAPTGLAADLSADDIVITWSPAEDSTIASYQVYKLDSLQAQDGFRSMATGAGTDTFFVDRNRSAAGKLAYFVRSVDASGNLSIPSDTLYIVLSSVTVTVAVPAGSSIVAGQVAFNGTASGAGIDRIRYAVDNGSWIDANGHTAWNFALETDSLIDGPHTVYVQAVDTLAGGTALSRTEALVLFVDNTAPVVSITGAVSGDSYDEPVTVGVAFADANLGSTSVSLNGSAVTGDTVVTEAGTYVLAYYAADEAGNVVQGWAGFAIDYSVPSLTIVQPSGGQAVNGLFTVAGTASDSGGLAEVMLGVTGDSGTVISLQQPVDSTYAEWSFVLNSRTFGEDGMYVLTVTATDAGGLAVTDSIAVLIDNAGPSVPGAFAASLTPDGHASLTWNAVADGDLGEYVLFRSTERQYGFRPVDTLIQTAYLDTALNFELVYYYAAFARDTLGNAGDATDIISTLTAVILEDCEDMGDWSGTAETAAETVLTVFQSTNRAVKMGSAGCRIAFNAGLGTGWIGMAKTLPTPVATAGFDKAGLWVKSSGTLPDLELILDDGMDLWIAPITAENRGNDGWSRFDAVLDSFTSMAAGTLDSVYGVGIRLRYADGRYGAGDSAVVHIDQVTLHRGSYLADLAPGAPAHVSAVPRNGNVTVTWGGAPLNGEADLAYFSVYRAEGSGAMTELATGLLSGAYVDSSASSGDDYAYAVRAVDVGGNMGPLSTPLALRMPLLLEDFDIVTDWNAAPVTGGTAIISSFAKPGVGADSAGMLNADFGINAGSDTAVYRKSFSTAEICTSFNALSVQLRGNRSGADVDLLVGSGTRRYTWTLPAAADTANWYTYTVPMDSICGTDVRFDSVNWLEFRVVSTGTFRLSIDECALNYYPALDTAADSTGIFTEVPRVARTYDRLVRVSPHPFVDGVTLTGVLPVGTGGDACLKVFTMDGSLLQNWVIEDGSRTFSINWDVRGAGSSRGAVQFIYELTAGDIRESSLLIKVNK